MRSPADALPQEFRLAAACCIWPRSQRRNQVIRDAAAGIRDWERVLRVTRFHRIDGLVQDGLTEAGISVPPTVAQRLRTMAARTVRQNLGYAAETIRLQAMFDTAAIPMLVLKGAPLAALAYGQLALKQARDIDLLIAPEQVDAAIALLEAEGYVRDLPMRPMTPAQRRRWVAIASEFGFSHSGRGITVELHWRMSEKPLLISDISVASPSQTVPLAGGTIRTLNDVDLFAYLAVHGASHGWARLKWLADFAALLAPMEPERIEALYRAAEARHAGRCPGQALLLCARLFDLPLPEALARELAADRKTRWLVAIALGQMIRREAGPGIAAGPAATLPILLSHILLGRGWRYGILELGGWTIGNADVMTLGLPSALHFLYPLIRLPSWLLRRLMRLLKTA